MPDERPYKEQLADQTELALRAAANDMSIRAARLACPACGLLVNAGTRFCPNDATPIQETFDEHSVPNYRLIRLIGSGGMGNVYEAEHVVLKNRVAIKLLQSHLVETTAFTRFQQEAQAASRLKNSNIVWVYDCGITQQGEPYMIMDLINGETLDEVLKRGPLPVDKSLKIFQQVCSGISCAHENGILHRDLKPSNIILEKQEHDTVARVLDFGIAKILESDAKGLLKTRTGDVFGTPAYMSPEQAEGRSVDKRSDIYSLGCILYEMLTGQPPVVGRTALEIMYKHVNEKPLTLTQASLGKKFPSSLEEMVDRCLARDPANRFKTIEELLQALNKVNAGSFASAVKADQIAKQGADSNNQHVLIWIGMTILLAIFIGIGLVTWSGTSQNNNKEKGAVTSVDRSSDEKFKVFLDSHHPNSLKTLTADEIPEGIHDESLAMLKTFGQLYSIDLSNQKNISSHGLLSLTHLKKLDILNLAKTNIDDEGITAINGITSLQHLDLSGTKITSEGLRSLSDDLLLTELNLSNTKITNVGFIKFNRFTHLDTLTLDNCTDVGNDAVAALAGLPLTTLSLKGTAAEEGIFATLKTMPDLESLTLSNNNKVGDHFITFMDSENICPNLKHFDLRNCPKISQDRINILSRDRPGCEVKVTDTPPNKAEAANELFKKWLISQDLANLKTIESTDIPELIDNRALAFLQKCPRLTNLDLSQHHNITNAGLESIVPITYLKNLNISDTQIDDKAIPLLNLMKNLTRLELGGTKITDDGLQSLTGPLHLKRLDLRRTKLQNAAFINFSRFKNLEQLSLNNCSEIGSDVLVSLEDNSLTELSLRGTNVSNAIGKLLIKFPRLERLDLSDNQKINGEVLTPILAKKDSLPNLVLLDLRNDPMEQGYAPNAVQQFRKQRPNCTVITGLREDARELYK